MLELHADYFNCRLEIYKETAKGVTKQLFDIPMCKDVMILNLGNESILVQYKDTSYNIRLEDNPVCYKKGLNQMVKEPKPYKEANELHIWLKEIRNTCQNN